VSVADALALLAPRRPRRARSPRSRQSAAADRLRPQLDFSALPRDPGVYLFRDDAGRPLYVGKSISIRSRARAHFAPSNAPAEWSCHASIVDYRPTHSELGALVLENRLIKQLMPPGNVRLARTDDRLLYIRCRLDIAFPILEVSPQPAAGHAVTVGPLRGKRLVRELVEQLDSIFGLRHCGRRLPRREYPSAYGQMGRCLSPCLGDLDPNLYRRRLDEALRLFLGDGGQRLQRHVESQMRAAAAEQRFERAAWLRRRLRRLGVILERLDGVLEATHARPRLVLAAHPVDGRRRDAFWLAGGRLVDWGALPDDPGELWERTGRALARGGRPGELGAHVPPDEIDEVRLVRTYLASHPELPQVVLEPPPPLDDLRAFAGGQENGSSTTSAPTASATVTLEPTGASRRTNASAIDPNRGDSATLAT
jgi:DNA polymerase-3 subunit epsilon